MESFASTDQATGSAAADEHDGFRYRVPRDLAVSPTALRRVLVIGSCLLAGLPDNIANADPGCPADYILFNNLSELPEDPPHPVDTYDFQLIQIPLRSVIPDVTYFRAPYSDPDLWAQIFEGSCERLRQYLDAAMRWNTTHGLLTFVANFMVPQQNPLGRLLKRYDLRNPVYLVERLNQWLDDEIANHQNAFILDLDQIAASFGRRYIQDDALWQINHAAMLSDFDFTVDQGRIAPVPPVSQHYTLRSYEFILAMWAELVAMFRTIRQIDAVKLVIVDLDDTLWRGVVAEEEQISDTVVEGWPLGFIEALGFLKRRGLLLAIVSKNDDAKVMQFWDKIFHGRLMIEDFAARRINWQPKADNIDSIIREVNVLPRSVVFVDDNPVERAAVQAAMPGIRVTGANQYYLRRIFLWAPETQVPFITSESARRTEMIQANSARDTASKRMTRPEFLASLNVKVRVLEIDSDESRSFRRAFELINKTNQFNTTGKRWTQEEMIAGFASGLILYAFEVEDRFAQYGVVGVIIASGGQIEQVVMSCRVVGLDVEIAAMVDVLRRIRNLRDIQAVAARLIKTDANLLCRTLFSRCGFTPGDDGHWTSLPGSEPQVPGHVELMLQ